MRGSKHHGKGKASWLFCGSSTGLIEPPTQGKRPLRLHALLWNQHRCDIWPSEIEETILAGADPCLKDAKQHTTGRRLARDFYCVLRSSAIRLPRLRAASACSTRRATTSVGELRLG